MFFDDLLDLDWVPNLEQLTGAMDALPPQIDLQADPDAIPPDLTDLHPALTDALGGTPEADDDFLTMNHADVGEAMLLSALETMTIKNPFA